MTRVLLIEDEPEVGRVIAGMLTSGGHEVRLIHDARQTLDSFRGFAPDVVVVDMLMPDQDGVETILQLRAERADVPIVAISGGGYAQPQRYLGLAEGVGAVRTLRKPFGRIEILTLLAELTPGA